MLKTEICLAFGGSLSDRNHIDLYDVSEAMLGFHRSIAITTHFILNGEVITQAPSLKGARIICPPTEEGSWKVTAIVIAAMYSLSTAPKDTPLGHLVSSAYSYVVKQSLGFHVDFEKSLGQQYEEYRKQNSAMNHISEERMDGVIEKCERSIKSLHRPIIASKTADFAALTFKSDLDNTFSTNINAMTYEYIDAQIRSDDLFVFQGFVSSYNINTYKGRVYIKEYQRTIPFEIAEEIRGSRSISLVVNSLRANAIERLEGSGLINFRAFKNVTPNKLLKSLYICEFLSN